MIFAKDWRQLGLSLSDWKEYKIADLVEIIFSGGTPNTKVNEYWNGSLPWLSSGETKNRYINSTEKTITESGAQNSSTRLALSGDVVMASAGQGYTRGQVSFLNVNTFINQSVIAIRANEKLLDKKFLFYNLSNRYEELRAISDSNSIRGSITTKMVKSMTINIPNLDTQKSIANVLSSIDDKIENNKKINHHLEQIALSIFNKHFGKAETTNKLGDFFPVITGKKDANVAKGGKYPFFSCSQNISYTDNYSFDNKAILLAGNGDFNVKIYDGKFEAYQRTYVLIPNNDEQFGYLYYAIKHFLNDITSGYRGSVIKFITKGSIESFNIFMTDDKKVLSLFNIFVEKIASNNKETQELVNLRDTLLPKLLSGEISVNQATK